MNVIFKRFQANVPRAEIICTVYTLVNMIWYIEAQLLVGFRNTEVLMGWMISREQNIKQMVETALVNKANIATSTTSYSPPGLGSHRA